MASETTRYAIAQSYLGWVLIAATERGICRIDFDDSSDALHARLKAELPKAELRDGDPAFKTALAFLEDPERSLELPLDLRGTAFQQRVWATLQNIPLGSTASYTDIAKQIGKPTAARAVARACAANQVAIAIPCHRVVRSDGKLAGYRWGIERKQVILEREAICAG